MNQIDNIMKLVHDMASDREIRTAIEQALTQGEPVEWSVYAKHGRIYFAIGNQSFPVDYQPEDEPECSAGQAAEWYMGQLRHALARLAAPQPQLDEHVDCPRCGHCCPDNTALLRQALEALEACLGWPHVITALKERLK